MFILNERSASGKTATVVVPEDQLSLAIGRDGQNARLAAKLTGWRIDIKSLSEASSDALYKLQNDPSLAVVFQNENETVVIIEAILGKKSDGRPLTPEEYDQLAQFVDRVERKAVKRLAEKKVEEINALDLIRKSIPASAFDQNILDSTLPEHVAFILQEAGYSTVGELAMQMKTHPDDVLRLQGIGPKAMTEISKLMESLDVMIAAEQAAEAEVPVEEIPAEIVVPVEAAAPTEP